ncbi:pyridoxamine 5'-phosphate oxidase family protein [Glaesserella sp.]|uniref:pyridoxamine 5'-phosphate oxidase family protein n=1 Tax=Glaesserella sp. TaxID=2094731 RepID=UPI00359F28DF
MQKRITSYIHKKYLCTVCCTENAHPWANVFYYVFDEENHRLIYVTSDQTYHAKVMSENPNVAGTIFTPTRFNPSLQGIQFTGQARILEGKQKQIAKDLYKQTYQHELIDQLSVWEISLEYVRMIDHSLGMFGTVEWRLGETEKSEFERVI